MTSDTTGEASVLQSSLSSIIKHGHTIDTRSDEQRCCKLPSSGVLRQMLHRMLTIRVFEECAVSIHSAGKMPGFVHTAIGQEAALVGACMALKDSDYITGNHRSHGHPIAKGAKLGPLMAELLGKATGVCRGKGGSMHLADFSVGCLGESGIVGSMMPAAVGAGLSARLQGTDQVCLCFFGDGAANCGAFHESLNLAAIWKLPVIFFCENNGYASTTPLHLTTSVPDIAARASAYCIPGIIVDGQDVLAVYSVVCAAVERARAHEGPSLVEAKTYRYREHSESNGSKPAPYRSDAEIEYWRARDPIDIFSAVLRESGQLTEAERETVNATVKEQVDAAVLFAQASEPPDPSALLEDVFR